MFQTSNATRNRTLKWSRMRNAMLAAVMAMSVWAQAPGPETLPAASVLTPDGKYLVMLTQQPAAVAVYRVGATLQAGARAELPDAGFGLTMTQNGRTLYVSGGEKSAVYEYTLSAAGELKAARTFEVAPADFIGDVALSPNDRLLYATSFNRDQVLVINPQSGRVIERVKTGRRPARIQFQTLGTSFFVTSWGNSAVYQHRVETAEAMGMTRTGGMPGAMVWSDYVPALTEDEKELGLKVEWKSRLFVAAANTNRVDVIGVNERGEVRTLETINLAFTPLQPAGMSPSSLALSADQKTLYVGCSWGGMVRVVDVSRARSLVVGAATARNPLSLAALQDGRVVAMGIGGSVDVLSLADPVKLGEATEAVERGLLYHDDLLEPPVGRSAIEHVVYVVKDPVKAGPVQLRWEEEFVRFANLTLKSGSAPGEQWALSAVANDAVTRMGKRVREWKGDPAAVTPAGTILTNAAAAGLSTKTYGSAEELAADAGKLPRLAYLRLGATGQDTALGLIAGALSKSPLWAKTAIFVINTHQTAWPEPGTKGYIISPYTRTKQVDTTAYGAPSMLRTMELILGLRPMTLFDAMAPAMSGAFGSKADLRPVD